MIIQLDSREKAKAITKILAEFDKQNIQYFVSKLFVGDYMSFDNPRLIIDRKQNLKEVCCNFSDMPKKDKQGKFKKYPDGSLMTEKRRFTMECERAIKMGIKLIILCEHGKDITCLEDVKKWVNPRLIKSPMAISGERLYKLMRCFGQNYDVEFLFCTKAQTGKRIIEILSGE